MKSKAVDGSIFWILLMNRAPFPKGSVIPTYVTISRLGFPMAWCEEIFFHRFLAGETQKWSACQRVSLKCVLWQKNS